jgi:hypothetical protein
MTQADFLHAAFPAPRDATLAEISGPRRFFNREISWLAFNWRVLDEASNPAVPLLERLRFLSISATNLDEFYTVRVAGLRAQVRAHNAALSEDGRSPAEQLALIHTNARRLMHTQQAVFNKLRKLMEAQGITLCTRSKLNARDLKFLETHFLEKVFPVLSPLAIDPAHPFPFIPNAGFSLALELEREDDHRTLKALLPIPQQIARFVPLPARDGETRFLPLEELLLIHLDMLFPGYTDRGHCLFRVLRDSDLEVEDEAEDLVREFETALKRRRRGEVIRLKISSGAPPELRGLTLEPCDRDAGQNQGRGGVKAPALHVSQGQDGGGQCGGQADPRQTTGDGPGQQVMSRRDVEPAESRRRNGCDDQHQRRGGQRRQPRQNGGHGFAGRHRRSGFRVRPANGSPSSARAEASCRSCPSPPAGSRPRRPRRRASTIWRSCPAGSRDAPDGPAPRPP